MITVGKKYYLLGFFGKQDNPTHCHSVQYFCKIFERKLVKRGKSCGEGGSQDGDQGRRYWGGGVGRCHTPQKVLKTGKIRAN